MKFLMVISVFYSHFYSHSWSVSTQSFETIQACLGATSIVRTEIVKHYETYSFFGSGPLEKAIQISCVEVQK